MSSTYPISSLPELGTKVPLKVRMNNSGPRSEPLETPEGTVMEWKYNLLGYV